MVISGCSRAPSTKPGAILSPSGTTTPLIIVRHAEQAKEHGESALTPAGRQRTQTLATHIDVTITLIPQARLSDTRRFADEFVSE